MITEIKSSSNEKIKYIKSLAQRKNRKKNFQYTVEGLRSVEEALLYADADCVVMTQEWIDKLDTGNVSKVYAVPDFIFEKISETNAPQGILAVVNMKREKEPFKADGAYIYCDNVRDPGNLGTIIRTADSAGFDGVVLSEDCVDFYNPKVVRASMGSFFRMNVYEDMDLSEFEGYRIYGGILSDDTVDYRDVDYRGGIVIIVGNEANGISEKCRKKCIPVKIPIYGGAESLNAAVAAAIMMYEAANKRHERNK